MFNQQKKPVAKPTKREQAKDYAVTILTNGCHFSGKLYCKGSTRIGGRIEGEIVSEGLLILEEEAIVQADIRADEIVVQGKVEGTVVAHSRVELSATCSFSGDIATPSLVIEEGARFNGRSSMETDAVVATKSGRKIELSKESFSEDDLKQDLTVAREKLSEVPVKVPEINANA